MLYLHVVVDHHTELVAGIVPSIRKEHTTPPAGTMNEGREIHVRSEL
jgi:hypothetical protein